MEKELGEKVRKSTRRQDIWGERGRVEVVGEGIYKRNSRRQKEVE
jgi:hypothetical protein